MYVCVCVCVCVCARSTTHTRHNAHDAMVTYYMPYTRQCTTKDHANDEIDIVDTIKDKICIKGA